ncbi:hypothetical protein [Mitsuaria sp. GD03876]|uniref:hypothetical protein n=1 Tax=Mitsuaria sp. GD03876 TaxID=2975399 RepID=UPI00244A23E2|nr:hypothetical protein [Mitsuaria sp. GD03876]MDH0867101.1 hypothetical protein [Mitsuaria sp. GD03876]
MTDRTLEPGAADAATEHRVAVVAVHGVADQAPGETVRALTALMTARAPAGVRYGDATCDCRWMAVPVLEGRVPASRDPDDRPTGMKALRQSLRSDFLRTGWMDRAARDGEADRGRALRYQAMVQPAHSAKGVARAPGDPRDGVPDQGIAFTDYLLFKAQRGKSPDEHFETRRIRMSREDTATRRTGRVDFHEMYWADLSRLSSALPTILTELFTILFRLSKLARDTIDQARHAADTTAATATPEEAAALVDVRRRWARLCRLQTALDWSFAHLLSNLFLQTLLMGTFIVVMSVLNDDVRGDTAEQVRTLIAVALPALAFWWMCYRHVRSGPGRGLLALMALASGAALKLVAAPWVLGVTVLVALALLCDAGLKLADRRFVSTRQVGLVFLAVSLGTVASVMLADAPQAPVSPSPLPLAPHQDPWVWWTAAALRAFEVMLLGTYVWWIAAAALLVPWTWYGVRQAGLCDAARASVATARLGLFVSVTSFTAVGMVIWAAGHQVLERAAGKWGYRPWLFDLQFEVGTDGWGFQHRVADVYRALPAESFLTLRYVYSTATFFLLAMLLLALVAYVLVTLVPSVLAEVRRGVGTAGNLGRWLTGGYGRLEDFIALLAIVSALVTTYIGGVYLLDLLRLVPPFTAADLKQAIAGTGFASQSLLGPFVIGSVSALGALTLFGRTLSKYVPWLRAPLDAMLDVDNYLREFPRDAIPRARIFARYVALLEQLKRDGATRVVIVSHSQGTVITADLLRYLTFRARQDPDSRAGRLGQWLRDIDLRLFTAGSPLRQLYAARFPDLYHWVRTGPELDQLGVDRWTNAFAAGDYVGRWIWAPAEGAEHRSEFYAPGAVAMDDGIRKDFSVGSGAHTHYFDPGPGSDAVAAAIDELIR